MGLKTIATIGAVLAAPTLAFAQLAPETRSLDELHQAALAEGGRVIVYAGGDTAGQQDGMKQAFEARFPGMVLDVIVDYSKYHEARLDNQIATDSVVPDVIQVQTLQNFPRWKAEGALMPYKPAGWDSIYDAFKDTDGAYTGIFVDAFSNVVNLAALPDPASWPREAADYLRPDLKGRIVLTWPTDDDAVLFWFKQVVDKYGWDYPAQLAAQEPIMVRGTQAPADYVDDGRAAATFSTDGTLRPAVDAKSRFVLPETDPFVAWPQQAAILAGAKHPEAAKLYLNWLLDKDTQENIWYMWSVRTDVTPPEGYKPIWDYPNADPLAFGAWMADRAAVESFRSQIGLYLGWPGETAEPPSPGHPGLHPDVALPH
ncbi:MAG: extracellular solute-binding protein [Paracoccus sp. (in: a-proteobacteria)]|uniref:ABC transporter substrate-binding protein n=1 Tax=Paracoccus sp. TaxID=267 RepID=UPI0026E0FE76|nr:extracellular solute-binding protein [Paracoccus sp. (in: a-proteobacteria)]MDO5614464.1 extracellular solute-binding protein [Paracoccus sp. (in: a-proteobacteria)]